MLSSLRQFGGRGPLPGSGQADFYFKSLWRAIATADDAAAGFDATFDYGEAESGAAGFALPREFGAIEGFENLFDFRVGNAGALIGDADRDVLADA
jgi:hypothetical protein